jgi:hypothetical protein
MIDNLITFFVRWPQCQQEWTSALTRTEISDALDTGKPIRVYASCHGSWDLNESHRQQLLLKQQNAT